MKQIVVDGNKIRNNLDIECPPFAQRQGDPLCFNVRIYIPEDEIWIDHAYVDEYQDMYNWEFGLKDLVGKKYLVARNKKIQELTEIRKKIGILPADYVIKESKVKDISTVFVKGNLIRKYFDPDFIFGGHHYVYSYIPTDQIWLDIKVDPEEIPFVYLHEKIERDLMEKGKNYEEGHEIALTLEKIERRKNSACYPGDDNYLRPESNLSDYFKFRPK